MNADYEVALSDPEATTVLGDTQPSALGNEVHYLSCNACETSFPTDHHSCPNCGEPPRAERAGAYLPQMVRRDERRHTARQSLLAWQALRTRRLELAVCTAAATIAGTAALVWYGAPALAAAAAVLGAAGTAALYRLGPTGYYALPHAKTAEGSHRCIFCGNAGTFEQRGLLCRHVHCSWCHTQLFTR